jgi:hypothetical protein
MIDPDCVELLDVDLSSTFRQALTAMTAIGKMTSTERNKSSADVLDKHADFFSQPDAGDHQPRLVKRDGNSMLLNNRAHYNPPTRRRPRTSTTSKATEEVPKQQQPIDEQNALR